MSRLGSWPEDDQWAAAADSLLLAGWRRAGLADDNLVAAVARHTGIPYETAPAVALAPPPPGAPATVATLCRRYGERAQGRGQVFTPRPLVDLLLDLAEVDQPLLTGRAPDRVTLFDPAVGAGAFTTAATERLVDAASAGLLSPTEARDQALDQVAGCDLDPVAVHLARAARLEALAPLLPGLPDAARRTETLITSDALALIQPRLPGLGDEERLLQRVRAGCERVVGNPPYVGEQGNRALFREVLRRWPAWRPLHRARMDYLYFFLALGVRLLQPGGRLAFVTSGYWPTADGAAGLRETLAAEAQVRLLADCGRTRWFTGASGHDTLLVVLDRPSQTPRPQPATTVLRLEQQSGQVGADCARLRQAWLGVPVAGISRFLAPRQPSELGGAPWHVLVRPDLDAALVAMERNSIPLGDLFLCRQGVVPSPLRVDADQIRRLGDTWVQRHDIRLGQGVFVLTDHEVEALTLNALERRLLRPYHKASGIAAYRAPDQPAGWLIYLTAQIEPEHCPNLIAHLERFRPLLDSRRRRYGERYRWFELHRPRTAALFDEPKLVAPYRAREACFAVASRPFYASTDVTFLRPRTAAVDLWAAAFLLNSAVMRLYARYRGRRKGELVELFAASLHRWPMPATMGSELSRLGRAAAAGQLGFAEMEAATAAAAYGLDWPLPAG